MATTSSVSSCLQYFVHISATGEPIPGTMFAVQKGHNQSSCKRRIAPLPPYQVAITKECRPKSGLRYFYRASKLTGKVLPNSLFAGTHKPANMCSLTDVILEFIIQSNPID